MISGRVHEGSLRPGRLEFSRLGWALIVSLLLHVGGYGGYKLGQKFHLWQNLRLPAWLEQSKAFASLLQPQEPPKPEDETPLMFVDVNPQAASTEAPKDTKFYSDKNSQAANPDADKDTKMPKIAGEQTDIVRTEDVQRSPYDRLLPAFPKTDQEHPAEEARPKAPDQPGDLAMAKPDLALREGKGTAEQSRPRTIKEAMLRQNRNQLVGQKMKSDAGTSRHVQLTSLDAKMTPFGAYDAAFIAAVEQRWFDLLDNMSYDGYRRGKVVLQFHLNFDGRITDLKIVENSVGDTLGLICEKAILDPSPFDRWPRDMRLAVDKDFRDIQFAFYYN